MNSGKARQHWSQPPSPSPQFGWNGWKINGQKVRYWAHFSCLRTVHYIRFAKMETKNGKFTLREKGNQIKTKEFTYSNYWTNACFGLLTRSNSVRNLRISMNCFGTYRMFPLSITFMYIEWILRKQNGLLYLLLNWKCETTIFHWS